MASTLHLQHLARKAFKGFSAGMAAGMALPGKLAGNIVGGFLAGMAYARQSVGGTYHDAARIDQTNWDWRAQLTSAEQSILWELDVMLARSRQAIANDGWAASAQGAFGRSVVGGGITARSAARHPTDPDVGLLRTFNAQCDRLWEQRCTTPRLVDAEQTKTMPEKQRVWMNELFAAGGVFVLSQYRPSADATSLILQEIEYEQRDELTTEFAGRPVRGGVETGDYGEPLAYHLYTAGHPLDEYFSKSRRVPAENAHHLYRQDRVLQRLGTPWMKPVLSRLRQLAMYEAYTVIQARGRAANVGFIKQQNAATAQLPPAVAKQLGVSNTAAGANDTSEVRVNVSPGLWTVLKPGQEPVLPTPASPDSMYPPFVTEHLKGIAAGTGLDFTVLCRWYAEASFAGNRQARLDMQAEVDWIQDLLFVQKICRLDREQWMSLAIREGRLKATGFFEDPTGLWRAAYLETNWQGPPKLSTDEIKDEAAWDMKIKAGRASPQDYCNVHGTTVEQTLSEIAEFRQCAAANGLADMVDAWLMGKASSVRAPKEGMAPDDPAVNPGGAGVANAGTSLGEMVARQHVLSSMLGEDGGNGRGRFSS